MKQALITILAISFSALSIIAEAQIYKWKDDKGQIHYSSTPPKPSEKNFDLKKGLSFYSKAATENPENIDTKKDKKQKANDRFQETSKHQLKFCSKEKSNLKLLQKNSTVTWVEKGKETLLSGKRLEDKIQAIKESIQTNCPANLKKDKK